MSDYTSSHKGSCFLSEGNPWAGAVWRLGIRAPPYEI